MILEWKIVAQNIYENLKNEISSLKKKPKLAVILVWKNSPSLRYINQKQKWAEYVWMEFELINYEYDVSEEELLKKITELNKDENIDWFMVQTPLPQHINVKNILNSINPDKDVDGFHPVNQWKIVIWDNSWLKACTPAWVIELCNYYNIEISWKNIVIIWRSNIVWKPLANLLINLWATVTICNSKTWNIDFYTKNADIVITAMGVAKFLKASQINKSTKVIDVWFSVIDDKIYWDCDFDDISNNWNDITPVPGGVWVLTVAMLISNTLKAYKNKN